MPCPRVACGESMVKDGYGTTCSLCARADTLPRPPTAEEAGDRVYYTATKAKL